MDLDMTMLFVDFTEARHQVWEKRQNGLPQPWTDDPLIAGMKFTNTYRVLDYGSQFLLNDLLEPDLSPEDTLMRCFLYRHTNLPSAWQAYRDASGTYPRLHLLEDLFHFWRDYRLKGNKVFSGAYMIYPQSSTPGTDKAESVILLTQRLFKEGMGADFLMADTPAERYAVLRKNKGVADFMSSQILTDWGYSAQCGEDQENVFVMPGPGAVRGAEALNPGVGFQETVRELQEVVWLSPTCPKLAGRRRPSLMDLQNVCCEMSKYLRAMDKPPTQPYRPAHPGPQFEPTLPSHW